jgi:hypothetical protein
MQKNSLKVSVLAFSTKPTSKKQCKNLADIINKIKTELFMVVCNNDNRMVVGLLRLGNWLGVSDC